MTVGAEYNWDEKRQAKKDGAVVVSNSGRGQNKGDAVREPLCIDYKNTDKASRSISMAEWKKHAKDSWQRGLEPVLVSIFRMHDGKGLATVDWDWLKATMDELEELKFRIEGLEK
jgi:hypothetical protein